MPCAQLVEQRFLDLCTDLQLVQALLANKEQELHQDIPVALSEPTSEPEPQVKTIKERHSQQQGGGWSNRCLRLVPTLKSKDWAPAEALWTSFAEHRTMTPLIW